MNQERAKAQETASPGPFKKRLCANKDPSPTIGAQSQRVKEEIPGAIGGTTSRSPDLIQEIEISFAAPPAVAHLMNPKASTVSRKPKKQRDEWTWADDWAGRQARTQALISKLEEQSKNQPFVASLLRQLRGCEAFVAVKDGKPFVHYSLCRHRWCPVCGHKHREDRRREIQSIITVRAQNWKPNPRLRKKAELAFLTLTIRAIPGMSCGSAMKRFARCWSRLLKDRGWRDLYTLGLGGAYGREIEHNAEKGWFHIHQHNIMEIPPQLTLQDVRLLLEEMWLKAGGGFIKISAVEKTKGALNETIKYTTKDITKSDEVLAEIITASHKKKLFGLFGSWLKARVEAKALRASLAEESEGAGEEPSDINEETGEVAELKDGRHSLNTLVGRARRGDWSAQWALKWFRWFLKKSNDEWDQGLVGKALDEAMDPAYLRENCQGSNRIGKGNIRKVAI